MSASREQVQLQQRVSVVHFPHLCVCVCVCTHPPTHIHTYTHTHTHLHIHRDIQAQDLSGEERPRRALSREGAQLLHPKHVSRQERLPAIQGVGDDGVANVGQMDADLVRAGASHGASGASHRWTRIWYGRDA